MIGAPDYSQRPGLTTVALAGLLMLPFLSTAHASEGSISSTPTISCFAPPDEPQPDTDQIERLNEYLQWRGFDLEPSATPAMIQIFEGRRVLAYYLTGAKKPRQDGASVYDLTAEIHQFKSADEAKTFSPVSTLLAWHKVDLHGPGVLEQHLALHTQSHWNGNLVLFLEVPSDRRMEPEDFAAAGLVKDKFIRAFLDYSDQAYEEERGIQTALAKVRQALDIEDAEGKAILFQVLDNFDQVDHASRLAPSERAALNRMLKEMISTWQSGITLASELLGQPAVAPAWVEPRSESLSLLVEYSESAAFLPFHREIEKSAIDLMYRMDTTGLQPSKDELEAIHAALKMEMDSGQIRGAWDLRHGNAAFVFNNLRVCGSLAGAIVSPVPKPDTTSGAVESPDTSQFLNTIPMISPLRSRSSFTRDPTTLGSFAIYLKKSDGRWKLRRMTQLGDAGWMNVR